MKRESALSLHPLFCKERSLISESFQTVSPFCSPLHTPVQFGSGNNELVQRVVGILLSVPGYPVPGVLTRFLRIPPSRINTFSYFARNRPVSTQAMAVGGYAAAAEGDETYGKLCCAICASDMLDTVC